MAYASLQQSPKRLAISRFLGSFTLVKGSYDNGRLNGQTSAKSGSTPHKSARESNKTKKRLKQLHDSEIWQHEPISPGSPAPHIDAQEALARQNNSKAPETLEELANMPSTVLYEATTVFPFTLFPDTITVDTEQIKILHKEFFMAKNINSINHEDVLNVTVSSGPFFATLNIATRFFAAEQLTIAHLWKKDAYELRYIIHGLMAARHRGVEINSDDKDKVKEMLKELGNVGQPDPETQKDGPSKASAGEHN